MSPMYLVLARTKLGPCQLQKETRIFPHAQPVDRWTKQTPMDKNDKINIERQMQFKL